MSWGWYWYNRTVTLERENSTLQDDKRRLSNQVTTLGHRARDLERERARLSSTVSGLSSQVSTLQHRVRESERYAARLSGELARRREEAREAGRRFMGAADAYQGKARWQVRAQAAELERAREAARALMGAADAYQEAARRRDKARAEEVEAARSAVLVVMDAADAYQRAARREVKDMAEEVEALWGRAAALEAELEEALARNRELEHGCEAVKGENGVLRTSEVERRLVVDLGDALVEAKMAASSSMEFVTDEEVVEIAEEVEDQLITHETKVEEIQTTNI
ncbi:hypothetical protein U9M48_036767 [Paspalum notatum var. saurae]|uniref:Uncharacterized protein n=1 Tax=Paspalum notatum var. saurae TaxID=547442 RepID=A0AAQ3UEM6_PASNO